MTAPLGYGNAALSYKLPLQATFLNESIVFFEECNWKTKLLLLRCKHMQHSETGKYWK